MGTDLLQICTDNRLVGIIAALGFLLWGVRLLLSGNRQIIRSSGLTMVLAAIYFLLTLLITPIYHQTQDIYRLASQGQTGNSLDLKSLLVILIIFVILFTVGFFRQYRRENSIKKGAKRWENF